MEILSLLPLAGTDAHEYFGIPEQALQLIILLVIIILLMIPYLTPLLRKKNAKKQVDEANKEAERIKKHAEEDAQNIIKAAKIQAKEELISLKDKFEQDTADRRKEIQRAEDRIGQREDNLDQKQKQVDRKLSELEQHSTRLKEQSERLRAKEGEINDAIQKQLAQLEQISGMTKEDAKDLLLRKLEDTLETERGTLIRRYQEENKQKLHDEAQVIMINAMQRYANDCTYERTTATIDIPSDEMKGRIIGREGRNIRTIEAATGVNVLIDDTPDAVVISCFDPVRREIARLTMERLVADGRIHPARVEEIVAKMKKEVENEIQKAGQEAVTSLGITHLSNNLINLIGRLKYRYSFSQNVLKHSIEVASMMGNLAAQLGLDERKAKRAGLLHDIGKAVDHEVEGTHAMIGADLLRRAGESEDIINAVAAHHEETPKTTLLANLVSICDTLSAGRPGARSETTEFYIKRIEQLEAIGNSFDGVESCFAIQAGRELRVIVKPEKITEDKAAVLAHDMANRIEKEMRYPGQIKVSIIRETRSIEYAK